MKKELKLKNPIKIDNKDIDVLSYDIEQITAQLFTEADVKKKQSAGIKNVNISPAVEFDFGLHLYLGFAAIIAINREYDFADLERIKGQDLMDVMHIGRDFLFKSEEDSNQSSLEEPSENTQESTKQE